MSCAGEVAAERFGRGHRLLLKRDFDAVLREPQLRLRRGPLWGAARPNDVGVARLGLVVAKKVLRRAVDRNRVKRVIRESFRKRRGLPALDIVVRLTEPRRLSLDHADRLFAALADVLAKRAEREHG